MPKGMSKERLAFRMSRLGPKRKSPKDIYLQHKANSNKRAVPFLLTFEEWWSIWQASGHWNERGPRQNQYCMSRIGDAGPYAVGNVFIATNSEKKAKECERLKKRRKLTDSC